MSVTYRGLAIALASVLLTSCVQTDPTSAVTPIPASSQSPQEPLKMPDNLTHLPVQLSLPYYPSNNYYEGVRAHPILSPYLDQKMVPALETSGDPTERLTQMAQAAQQARVAFGESGQQADFSFQGLDPVETDLRVAFFVALSQAIVNASDASPEAKLMALKQLLPLIKAEAPVGIPEPSDFAAWNATARITAETEIMVHIEDLENSEN